MSRTLFTRLAAWLLVAACVSSSQWVVAQGNKPAPPPPPKLKVGDTAPDFKLQYFDGDNLKDVVLSQYRGKSDVILAFYIFAFTGG